MREQHLKGKPASGAEPNRQAKTHVHFHNSLKRMLMAPVSNLRQLHKEASNTDSTAVRGDHYRRPSSCSKCRELATAHPPPVDTSTA